MSVLAAPLASRTYTRRNRLGPITLAPHETDPHAGAPAAVTGAATGRAAISLGNGGNMIGSVAANGHPFAAINGFINAAHPSGGLPIGIPPNGLSLGKGPPASPHFISPQLMMAHPSHSVPTIHQLPLNSLRNMPPSAAMMSMPHPILLPGALSKGAPLVSVISPPSQSSSPALVHTMRALPKTSTPSGGQSIMPQPPTGDHGATQAATQPAAIPAKTKIQRPTSKQRAAQAAPSQPTGAVQSTPPSALPLALPMSAGVKAPNGHPPPQKEADLKAVSQVFSFLNGFPSLICLLCDIRLSLMNMRLAG